MNALGATAYNRMEQFYTAILAIVTPIISIIGAFLITRGKMKEIEKKSNTKIKEDDAALRRELTRKAMDEQAKKKPYPRIVEDMKVLETNFKKACIDYDASAGVFNFFTNGTTYISGTPVYTQHSIFEYLTPNTKYLNGSIKHLFNNIRSAENANLFSNLMDEDGLIFIPAVAGHDDLALKHRVINLGIRTYIEVMIKDHLERPLASVIFMYAEQQSEKKDILDAMRNWLNQQRPLL